MSDVLSTKDNDEVLNVKKAAMLGGKIMGSFVVGKLEETIDKEKKIKHSRLSGEGWGGEGTGEAGCQVKEGDVEQQLHQQQW